VAHFLRHTYVVEHVFKVHVIKALREAPRAATHSHIILKHTGKDEITRCEMLETRMRPARIVENNLVCRTDLF
jgi:hypothetical protein